jgi:hypothetical protein
MLFFPVMTVYYDWCYVFLYWLSIITDAILSCMYCLLWLMVYFLVFVVCYDWCFPVVAVFWLTLCFPVLTVYYDCCYNFLYWLSIMIDAILSCIYCLLWLMLYFPVLTVYYDWCYVFQASVIIDSQYRKS